jgi:hypothetical protein
MILDYEQELTTRNGGEIFTAANVYGDRPYDLMAAGIDAAVGEPLYALYKVDDVNVDALTSLAISIVNDTDGAGAGEVTMVSRSVNLADLTVAAGVQYIGAIRPGLCALRYLTAKGAVTGSDPTVGKIKVWLTKDKDAIPANAGFTG